MRLPIILLAFFMQMQIHTIVAQYSWTRDVENPIVTGENTTIQHIADPCVIYDNGMFRMWAGCVESNVSYASICYAESVDGTTWTEPAIVFSPSQLAGAWDNMKTEIPTVIKDTSEVDPSRRYKMWYGGADSLKSDSMIIGFAFSSDGISWTRLPAAQSPYGKDGLVMIPGYTLGDAAVLSDPTAVKKDGVYHLWYNSFGASNDVLISHAISTDGASWTKDNSNPVMIPTEPWEDFGPGDITADLVQPTVMIHPATGEFFMCYGSFDATIYERYSGFGYATSADGTAWTKDVGNPFFLPDTLKPGEEIGIHANSIVYVSGTYHMFYGGVNNLGVRNILHASSPDTTLNIKEPLEKCLLNIYPNPVVDYLSISYDNHKIESIEVYNLQSQKIIEISLSNNVDIIDFTDFARGVYIVKITIGSNIIIRKVVKN